jgi:hypothetical protein
MLQPLPDDPATPITVREALDAGLTRKRLRSKKTWRTPFSGVRLAADAPDDLVTECRALATTLDDGVAFSHVTALRLLGVEVPWTMEDDADLHVVTRDPSARPDREGVRAHWSRQPFLDTIEVEGLPITSPAQTFIHVGVELRRPDDVVVLGDAMMRRERMLTTTAEVARLAERTHKVKGIVQVREQIARMRPGTDSVMETRTRLLLVAANLPCPVVNEVVWAPDGDYVKRVDMLYPQDKIAIEYDGDQHRTDKAQWRDDIRRRRRLQDLGWTVIVVVADDVTHDPAGLIDRVRSAIDAATARGRRL